MSSVLLRAAVSKIKLDLMTPCLTVLLCSCGPVAPPEGAATVVHEIAGAETKFCVPMKLDIQAPPWVPENQPGTPSGFAFEGCWSPDGSTSQLCGLPSVLTAGVGPRTSGVSDLWQDMSTDHYYRTVLLEPNTDFEIVDSGSTVLATKKGPREEWFVWHKEVPIRSAEAAVIARNDRLAAVCHFVEVTVPKVRDTRRILSCQRNGISRDYSFDYTFESKGRIPSRDEMSSLDQAVMSTIDSWRCD